MFSFILFATIFGVIFLIYLYSKIEKELWAHVFSNGCTQEYAKDNMWFGLVLPKKDSSLPHYGYVVSIKLIGKKTKKDWISFYTEESAISYWMSLQQMNALPKKL